MSNVLFSVIGFIVALGLLIVVHEFGHFWVARRLGVKVLRFSIGFGKPLWQTTRGQDGTQFVISAVPLGGYVKMLDEREGEVASHEVHRAFNRQPLHYRSAIVAAGPTFNFLFAILAYWLMFMLGLPGIKPVVGEVIEGSAASMAGIHAGHEIVAVEGRETPTWGAASLAVLDKTLSAREVRLGLRDETGRVRVKTLVTPEVSRDFGKQDGLVMLGMRPWLPEIPPIIGKIQDESPAQRAGLQAGDIIVNADGMEIGNWNEWVDHVRQRPETEIIVIVERAGMQVTLALTPQRVVQDGEEFGRIGAGVQTAGELPPRMRAVQKYDLFPALGAALAKTWDMSIMSLRVLGRMVIGQVSLENLSGPITIAQYAGYSAQGGMVTFLAFLAIVSLSLGVINLLPVPLLDGGHLLYYGIELVKGSPLSENAQALGQKIGIFVLLMLMSLALYNDLVRLFG